MSIVHVSFGTGTTRVRYITTRADGTQSVGTISLIPSEHDPELQTLVIGPDCPLSRHEIRAILREAADLCAGQMLNLHKAMQAVPDEDESPVP